MEERSERPRHLLNGEAFDDVAFLEVLVIGEAHAAFLTGGHLVDIVLEALELRQLAFMNDNVVAN